MDPTLTVLGPDASDHLCPSNAYDGNGFIQDFLLRLYNNPGGNTLSFLGGIDFHHYPYVSGFPAGFAAPASGLYFVEVNQPGKRRSGSSWWRAEDGRG